MRARETAEAASGEGSGRRLARVRRRRWWLLAIGRGRTRDEGGAAALWWWHGGMSKGVCVVALALVIIDMAFLSTQDPTEKRKRPLPWPPLPHSGNFRFF